MACSLRRSICAVASEVLDAYADDKEEFFGANEEPCGGF